MPAIKQSVCFNPFNRDDITPEQLVVAAAKIGYKSVEMAAAEHWPLIRDHGLDIAIVKRTASPPKKKEFGGWGGGVCNLLV